MTEKRYEGKDDEDHCRDNARRDEQIREIEKILYEMKDARKERKIGSFAGAVIHDVDIPGCTKTPVTSAENSKPSLRSSSSMNVVTVELFIERLERNGFLVAYHGADSRPPHCKWLFGSVPKVKASLVDNCLSVINDEVSEALELIPRGTRPIRKQVYLMKDDYYFDFYVNVYCDPRDIEEALTSCGVAVIVADYFVKRDVSFPIDLHLSLADTILEILARRKLEIEKHVFDDTALCKKKLRELLSTDWNALDNRDRDLLRGELEETPVVEISMYGDCYGIEFFPHLAEPQ